VWTERSEEARSSEKCGEVLCMWEGGTQEVGMSQDEREE